MKDYFEEWNNKLAQMDMIYYGNSYQLRVTRSKWNPFRYLMKSEKMKRIHPINFMDNTEL